MADDKSEVKGKNGISILVLALGCVFSILLGLVGGVVGGPTIKSAFGFGEEPATKMIVDRDSDGIDVEDPTSLFAPMPGVFFSDKDRFYADAGEFLVAINYQGRTRYPGYQQSSLVMTKILWARSRLPAIRNGLSIFFTQQDLALYPL